MNVEAKLCVQMEGVFLRNQLPSDLETWSFNPPIIHLAKKFGLTDEGTERELLKWMGRVNSDLLQSEW